MPRAVNGRRISRFPWGLTINPLADPSISSEPGAGPCLGADGYVRLALPALHAAQLVHLLSGLDDDVPFTGPQGAQQTAISGYTEWLSSSTPTLTLGWDWELRARYGHVVCVRTSVPRSNIMLIGAANDDLGAAPTASLLATAVDAMPWQGAVLAAIGRKFS